MPNFSSDQASEVLAIMQEINPNLTLNDLDTLNQEYDVDTTSAGFSPYIGPTSPGVGDLLAAMSSDTGYSASDITSFLVAMWQVLGGTAVNPNPTISDYLDAGASGVAQGVESAASSVASVGSFVSSNKTLFFIGGGVLLVILLAKEL